MAQDPFGQQVNIPRFEPPKLPPGVIKWVIIAGAAVLILSTAFYPANGHLTAEEHVGSRFTYLDELDPADGKLLEQFVARAEARLGLAKGVLNAAKEDEGILVRCAPFNPRTLSSHAVRAQKARRDEGQKNFELTFPPKMSHHNQQIDAFFWPSPLQSLIVLSSLPVTIV